MKKIAFKASVIALSTALAVTPMAFAQTPVSQGKVAAADTQPLPGAKKSSAAIAAATGLSIAGATALVVGLVIAGAITVDQANKANSDDSAAIAAILAAAGTTGTR